MKKWCSYCDSLHRAFENENYCSQQGDSLAQTKTNAFYLRTKQLNSGKHYSRWTIRAVLDGYQHYHKQSKEHLLQSDNYLLIGEGEAYSSEIVSDVDVEAMIVAFQPTFIQKAIFSASHSSRYLLDHPEDMISDISDFWPTLYPRTASIDQLFHGLKDGISKGEKTPLFYEEIFSELLLNIVDNHLQNTHLASLIPAKKRATRQELFHRLRTAKDYLDTQLANKVSLEEVSRVSLLSPCHFLRLFRQVYSVTPFQYLTQQRLKLAQYLLRSSSYSVQEISQLVGYDDQGAFARWFKRYTRQAPSQYRSNS